MRWPGFSGMVSFRHPDAAAIAARTRLFTLAESLGGVESLIEVPQAMTHQSVEGSTAAVPADLVRLSCGVEDPGDLVADLARRWAEPQAAGRGRSRRSLADGCWSESVLPSGSENQTTSDPAGAFHTPSSSWSIPW